jgi:hypothetical protein
MRASPAINLYLLALISSASASCDTRHVVGQSETPIAPCGVFTTDLDLKVCTAGYAGGSDKDFAPVVDIATDGSLILASRGTIPDAPTSNVHAQGQAILFRIDPTQARILASATLGNLIEDLEIEPVSGAIAVVGEPFGVAVIEPNLSKIRWSAPIVGHRVSIGVDGTVAVLNRNTHAVSVFSPKGEMGSTFMPRTAGGQSADLAVDGTAHQVIIAGAGPGESAIQPVLDAHGYDGTSIWRNYNWTPEIAAERQLTAATRGVRVQVGRDGQLYFLAECDGGNTSVGRNPRNISEPASLVSYDANNTPYNTNQPMLFVARFAPAVGTLAVGQVVLARANTMASAPGIATHPTALAANQDGMVLVVGTHGCCAPKFAGRKVAGQTLAASSSDAFALMLTPDMRERPLWTTFGRGSPSRGTAAAFSGKQAALVAIQTTSDAATAAMTQYRPLQTVATGLGTEVYIATWPTP